MARKLKKKLLSCPQVAMGGKKENFIITETNLTKPESTKKEKKLDTKGFSDIANPHTE